MTARTAMKDLSTLLEPIEKISSNWIAKPPSFTKPQVQLLNYWKRYIAWERSNPLHIEEKSLFVARVLYAYKSALLMLRYFPEIWFDAATFLIQNDRSEEAIQMLQSGISANPTSLLISFTLAEYLESKKVDFAQVTAVFDQLIERLEKEHEEANARFDKEREALISHLKDTLMLQDIDNEDEGERRERERELQKEHEKEVELRVETQRKKKISQIKESITLVWIVYMRLTRRSQSIRAARLVFSKARKSNLVTSHVFTASGIHD
jgi:cleavage stimulation factor subunit 3